MLYKIHLTLFINISNFFSYIQPRSRYISTKQSDKTDNYVLTIAGGVYDLSKEIIEYNEIT